MLLRLLSTALLCRAGFASEFSFPGGNNYQGGSVQNGAVSCAGGTCADEAEQSVSIYSLGDIAKDVVRLPTFR